MTETAEAKTPNNFLDVRMFHARFFQPTDMPTPDGSGTEPAIILPEDQYTFRRKFLFEEFDEYAVAFNKGNLIKAADALIDFQYVIFGTALFMRAGHKYFKPNGWPTFAGVCEQAAGLGLTAGAPSLPRLLTPNAHEFAHRMLSGNLELFCLAHQSGEPNAIPMALGSLWNLSFGVYLTAAQMGLPWEKLWAHVQEANMSKVRAQRDGSDSARGSGWDVIKPIGWCAPDLLIAHELKDAGADIPPEYMQDARNSSEPKV